MKYFIISCFMALGLKAHAQHVTIQLKEDQSLNVLFRQIESQSEYKMAFNDNIDVNKHLNKALSFQNIGTSELVGLLNKELPYRFSLVGNNILVKNIPVASEEQQSFRFSGIIRDTEGLPLPGATIYIPELQQGATSDIEGRFSLKLQQGTYTVTISYIGFDTVEKKIVLNKDTQLDVKLSEGGEVLEEVIVTQNNKATNIQKAQMSVNRLSMEEIKQIPVAMGEPDPLKSLLTLPGVTNAGEGSSGFNVRGGAADQNLVLLDNVPVYNDSHLFGFFSVFNADAVNSLDLYKGGIPSRYGGRVSSVLDVQQQNGSLREFGVNGGIGLISSRLQLDGPFQRDKGSFMVAGRTSYAHLFLKLTDNDNSAYFYDINAKLNYQINENNSLHFSGYKGNDIFDLSDNFLSTYGNTMGKLNWKHRFGTELNTDLTVFYSDYQFGLTLNSQNFGWDSAIKSYGLKYDWQHGISERFRLNYGIESIYYDFNPGTLVPTNEESSVNFMQLDKKYALESAMYLDLQHQISEKLHLNYGLRYSMFHRFGAQDINTYEDGPVTYNPTYDIYEKSTPTGSISYGKGEVISSFRNFEPRVALSFVMNEETSIKASYNRMVQYLHIISNSQSPTPVNIWAPSGPFIEPQLLDQFAIGYFRNFAEKRFSLETEVFYKKIKNRIDYIDGADLIANNELEQVLLNGKARAYGLELLLRKNTGNLTGWIAYTLSRAEQKTTGRDVSEPGIANGDWYLSPYDKLHNLSVTGNYFYTDKWSFSANFSLQSGQPVTFPNGYYEIGGIPVPNYALRNENRLPIYHHLDLAATYTPKPDRKKGWQSYWVFSIYNIYNRKNAASIRFTTNDDTGANEARRLSIFGILPSISYNFKF
ncbi:TonB-dependent receptor [Robertkochia solimangrovi]|uniref:TonB-dependent receptor n=1 Tax=Robertkochia solimangrovi TaxID=2213046 RepID=UPI0011800033|nr:TonB-dependent receptor [Robertkochia solimangrovi]TRZ41606.1 hypothetical protein DMZ48_16485 [Robertkochia solimangrovi]